MSYRRLLSSVTLLKTENVFFFCPGIAQIRLSLPLLWQRYVLDWNDIDEWLQWFVCSSALQTLKPCLIQRSPFLLPFCQISPRHNMAMLNVTSKLSGFDSSYPSSPPSTDSEVEYSSPGLHASIAAVPDSTLRAIMIKLAESSPHFHRAIMKELGSAQASGESPLTTPTTPKIRKPERRRSKRRSHHKTLTVSTQTPIHNHQRHISNVTVTERLYQSGCVYHSGQFSLWSFSDCGWTTTGNLEIYEFLSGTPDDMAHEVRTLRMWSCCDEDEWSPGCMSAAMIPPQYKVEHDDRYDANPSYDDVFPDSDLEERLDLNSRLLSQSRWTTNRLWPSRSISFLRWRIIFFAVNVTPQVQIYILCNYVCYCIHSSSRNALCSKYG